MPAATASRLEFAAPTEPQARGRAERSTTGVSLASLAPGTSASIVAVDHSCPEGERLLDLGFIPGTRVEIVKRAPLGDPVIYELRGYRICLRRAEANRIRVKPE
jgi:Fe2+ transport system protein FeoA